MNMAGRVVVVTGGSMGIGEAIAARFLREQASVVLASRDLARVEAARQRLGADGQTLAVACDVTVRAQIEALLAAALERFGRVDVWVNNAGPHYVGVPFGGYKQSGVGREESIEELFAFSQAKNVNITL